MSIALIKGSTLVYIAPPPLGICVEGLFGKLLQKPFLFLSLIGIERRRSN